MNITLYRKTLKASRELHGEIKKEGKGYNYKYFRTEDILPLALEKMEEHEFGYKPDFEEGYAILRVFDTDPNRKNDEENIYRLPIFVGNTTNLNPDKLLQLAGKLQTYYLRYLLIQVFSICEPDLVEIENQPTKIEEPKHKDMNFKKIISYRNFIIKKIEEEGEILCLNTFCKKVKELFNDGILTRNDVTNLQQAYELGGDDM